MKDRDKYHIRYVKISHSIHDKYHVRYLGIDTKGPVVCNIGGASFNICEMQEHVRRRIPDSNAQLDFNEMKMAAASRTILEESHDRKGKMDNIINFGFPRSETGMWPGSEYREARASTLNTFHLTEKESREFMRLVEATSEITSHHELFLVLQNEFQCFIRHQILISAWGDFHGSKPKLDVVSAIPGIRTGLISGCCIEPLMKDFFARWVAGGRRPLLLDNAASHLPTHCTCHCAMHFAMRRMHSVMVHGIRDERDELDTLYVALNPVSVKNGHSTEHFNVLIDSLIAQIDLAFRKVATLKSADTAAGEHTSPKYGKLSGREREVLRWITEGKTNYEVAAILGISFFTVKNHAQRIFKKLDATNRTEAAANCR